MARHTVVDTIPVGNLGNRMFQYMLTEALKSRCPGLEVGGVHLPEWGIESGRLLSVDEPVVRATGQFIDLRLLAWLINSSLVPRLEIAALGLRMDNHASPDVYSQLFPRDPSHRQENLSGYLLINVRGAEILTDVHLDYGPLPISFYQQLVEGAGLTPLFMGQIGDDAYSKNLRAAFPNARFEPSRGAVADFDLVRSAGHVVMGISTFSWLAAWLSNAQTIHMPLTGMFHPLQRPDIDLIPISDCRFRWYDLGPRYWTASPDQVASLFAPRRFRELDAWQVSELQLKAKRALQLPLLRYRFNAVVQALLHRLTGRTVRLQMNL